MFLAWFCLRSPDGIFFGAAGSREMKNNSSNSSKHPLSVHQLPKILGAFAFVRFLNAFSLKYLVFPPHDKNLLSNIWYAAKFSKTTFVGDVNISKLRRTVLRNRRCIATLQVSQIALGKSNPKFTTPKTGQIIVSPLAVNSFG